MYKQTNSKLLSVANLWDSVSIFVIHIRRTSLRQKTEVLSLLFARCKLSFAALQLKILVQLVNNLLSCQHLENLYLRQVFTKECK